MNLVCDVHGVRTVNGVLEIAQEEFQRQRTYRYVQVEEIVARLSSTEENRIHYNIKHDFANHTIQQVLDFNPGPILHVIAENFAELAKHNCANYVVQRSIKKAQDSDDKFQKLRDDHVLKVYELFLEHKDNIMEHWRRQKDKEKSGEEIARALDERLKGMKRIDLAMKLH